MNASSRALRAPAGVIPPQVRTLAFLALIVCEGLWLMLALDTQGLLAVPSVWALLVGWSPQVLRLGIAIALASVLVGGRSIWMVLTDSRHHAAQTTTVTAAFVALHAAGVAAFAWVSAVYFAGESMAKGAPAALALAWIASAAVMLIGWLRALLPFEAWARLAREHRAVFAAASAVGTVVWTLGFVSDAFWQPLARYTYAVVASVLGLFYSDVVSRPDTLVLGTPAFSVRISPQCSGYEGIGLIVGFLSVYLFGFRKELRFPSALVLLPIGAVTIWILNAARIVGLVAIGDAGWREVALGGFHSQAGWLAFNAVGLGFVAVTRRGGYFKAKGVTDRPLTRRPDTTSPYLAPFLALLAAAMITGAVWNGFDWLYPVRLVALGAALWTFRTSYAALTWRVSWVGVACGFAAFALWMLLLPDGANGKSDWPAVLESAGALGVAWLVVRTVGYVLAVPLAEELAFRGYLTRRFWRTEEADGLPGTFVPVSFVLSSVIFGAFHGQFWLPGVLSGMLFALALYRRGSIGDAVMAHATTNGLIAAYVFATGQWFLWS